MLAALEQWRRFRRETGFTMEASEQRVYHPLYRYAGTFDLRGTLTHAGQSVLIDIKRSFLAGRAIGLQLAAYDAADAFPAQSKRRRYALKLNENGPYRLEEFNDPKDFGVFVAALTLHHFKEKERQECPKPSNPAP
jgi:hypothetical protein